MEKIKLVVVGDGTVGKTSFLISYTSNAFPEEYVPTVFDNHRCNLQLEDRTVMLDLYDTAGQEDYDQLRPMSYSQTDVFVICYSIVDKESFSSIETKWIPELKKYNVSAPIIIVGTKSDLADGMNPSDCVSEETVKKFVQNAHNSHIAGSIRCSAKTRYNLENAFQMAINVVLYPEKKETTGGQRQSGSCCIIC